MIMPSWTHSPSSCYKQREMWPIWLPYGCQNRDMRWPIRRPTGDTRRRAAITPQRKSDDRVTTLPERVPNHCTRSPRMGETQEGVSRVPKDMGRRELSQRGSHGIRVGVVGSSSVAGRNTGRFDSPFCQAASLFLFLYIFSNETEYAVLGMPPNIWYLRCTLVLGGRLQVGT
jgi:hypothetical protein